MKMSLKSHPDLRAAVFGLAALALCAGSLRATSLWDEESNGGRSLFTDRKALRKGDLVTIVVDRSTTSKKDQSTETSKTVSELARLQICSPDAGLRQELAAALPDLQSVCRAQRVEVAANPDAGLEILPADLDGITLGLL